MAVDAVWVGYPKSWTKGRNRPVQFVTLHYTAGSEGNTSAEAGAAYDKRREDGTSTHYFTDSEGLPVWEVPIGDRAHTARRHGNEIGVHIEICGTRQTRAQWLDAVSTRTLKTTAKLVAQLCLQLDLPVKRLSTAETRAAYYAEAGKRPKGINDHYACTYAFPEDGGTHEDVGPAFPWDVFMVWVQDFYEEEGGMATGYIGLKKGNTTPSTNVKGLQERLKRAGYDPGALDGIYGESTAAAVLACRKAQGSSATTGDEITGPADAQIEAAVAEAKAKQFAGGGVTLVPHQHKYSMPAVVGTTGPAEPTA